VKKPLLFDYYADTPTAKLEEIVQVGDWFANRWTVEKFTEYARAIDNMRKWMDFCQKDLELKQEQRKDVDSGLPAIKAVIEYRKLLDTKP